MLDCPDDRGRRLQMFSLTISFCNLVLCIVFRSTSLLFQLVMQAIPSIIRLIEKYWLFLIYWTAYLLLLYYAYSSIFIFIQGKLSRFSQRLLYRRKI